MLAKQSNNTPLPLLQPIDEESPLLRFKTKNRG